MSFPPHDSEQKSFVLSPDLTGLRLSYLVLQFSEGRRKSYPVLEGDRCLPNQLETC